MSALTDPWIPRGLIATSGWVTNGSPASTASTVTVSAATGLHDVPFTAIAGRRYVIKVKVAWQNSSGAGGIVLRINDGGGSAPVGTDTQLGEVARFPAAIASAVLTAHFETPDITGLTTGAHHLGLFFRALAAGTATALDGSTASRLDVYDDGLA